MIQPPIRSSSRSRADRVVVALLLVAGANLASAQAPRWHGFVDLRASHAGGERSFLEGGEGRLRGGDGGAVEVAAAALVGSAQLTPALLAFGNVQFQNAGEPDVDVVEAYLRWRPVSTTRSRWSLQAGAFFPPLSLENDAIGWSSRWTLSSSAINTWIGEELRTIGLAGGWEWRGDEHSVEASAALYGWNDPVGEILFARGWALIDVMCGIGCRLREPDAVALALEEPLPRRYDPYVEIDDRIGWYAGASWEARGRWKLALLRYDNNADGSTEQHQGHSEIYTWDTRFWNLGAQTSIGDVVLVAQAMHGSTYFAPSPFFQSETEFDAGFVLAGWNRGAWRPALRLDLFHTREFPSDGGRGAGEHGRALTLALNWRPRPWLRVTGELLRIEGERSNAQQAPVSRRLDATQLQVNARLLF
jgi:hypothetical protein